VAGRGPVPGLAAVLEVLGVSEPHLAARAVTDHAGDADPWPLLESIFAEPASAPGRLRTPLPHPVGRIWTKLPAGHRSVMKLLSALDIGPGQVHLLMEGRADVELEPEHLLDNLYLAATCTYGMSEHVPFPTIDRALFPPSHVTWQPPVDEHEALEGPLDRRRIEALLADVLERHCAGGDTVVPYGEALELANGVNLGQPVTLNGMILTGLDLDHDSLLEWPEWSPLTSVALADGSPAYKLARYADTADVIRGWIADQEGRIRLGTLTAARAVLDDALTRNRAVDMAAGSVDESEERARTEKAAGLSVLHDSPLAVLIGPAGTGKTTLLKALVETPGSPRRCSRQPSMPWPAYGGSSSSAIRDSFLRSAPGGPSSISSASCIPATSTTGCGSRPATSSSRFPDGSSPTAARARATTWSWPPGSVMVVEQRATRRFGRSWPPRRTWPRCAMSRGAIAPPSRR
jgi:hypothetical protein